jgi:hypothetical protein
MAPMLDGEAGRTVSISSVVVSLTCGRGAHRVAGVGSAMILVVSALLTLLGSSPVTAHRLMSLVPHVAFTPLLPDYRRFFPMA